MVKLPRLKQINVSSEGPYRDLEVSGLALETGF